MMFAAYKEMLNAILFLLALTHLSEGVSDSNELVNMWAEATSPTSLNITWSGSQTITVHDRNITVGKWIVVVSTSPTQRPSERYIRVEWFKNTLFLRGLSPNTTYYIFLYCVEKGQKGRFNRQIAKSIHVTTHLKAKPTTTTPVTSTPRTTSPVRVARSTEGKKLLKKDNYGFAHTSESYTLTNVSYTPDSRLRQESGNSAHGSHQRTSRRPPRPTPKRTGESLRPTRYPSESTLEPNKYANMRKYILSREEVDSFSSAAPERKKEGSSSSTVATTSTNSSDSDALSDVASQRKQMVIYISVAVVCGFILIVLLSALTLLCYRPWRKSQGITMRKKSSSCAENPARDSKTAVPNTAINDMATRESYAQESSGPRHPSFRDLPEAKREVPSVISWGSEFDLSPAENIYSNTDGMTTVSGPTTGGTVNRPQLPPVAVTIRRSTAGLGQSGSMLKPQDKDGVYVNYN